jgi:transcriptional regulator with XRE-family HTH domain
MSQFSSQLRVLLEKRRVSQTALHKRTGISQGSISRYLSGKLRPRPGALERICNAFPLRADRNKLLTANAQDSVPVRLRAKHTTGTQVEGDAQYRQYLQTRARMPADLRAAYDKVGADAIEHKHTADFVINFWKIIQSHFK